jgi:hypothetical protein
MFLLLEIIVGYLISLLIFNSGVLKIASSVFVTSIVIIVFSHFFRFNYSFIAYAIISFIIFLISFLNLKKRSVFINIKISLKREELILLIINTLIWFFLCSISFGYDEINHAFYVAQILHGTYPPLSYFPLDAPVVYHYGWDILVATVCKEFGFTFPYASSLLILLFVLSNSLLLIVFLKNITDKFWILVIVFFVFQFGDGILKFVSEILGETQTGRLSYFSMINQPAWLFTTSWLLIIVNLIVEKDYSDVREIIKTSLFVFILGSVATIYSATSVLLIGLFLSFLGFQQLSLKKYKQFLLPLFTGIALLIFWNRLNSGILVNGSYYDQPVFRSSISLLGLKNYIKYEGAYILMTPITIGVIIYMVFLFIKREYKTSIYPKWVLFLFYTTILCYFIPFFILTENSAYWDNFCKFNYIGVLSSFLLLPYVIKEYYKKNKLNQIGLILFLVIAFISTIINLFNIVSSKDIIFGSHRLYEISINKTKHLTEYASNHLNSHDKVLALNKNVTSHFVVDRKSNKAMVSSYDYMLNNFGEFLSLPFMLGIPVINYYDYNFMINRQIEYKLVDNLNLLYGGNISVLNSISVDYLIMTFDKKPAYIDKLVKLNMISLVAYDKTENWLLFKKQVIKRIL